ncbi:MAG: hypothetical protein IJZ21_00765 [Clostridia bacterium]|nr:hypothetical protein [Clostridia bacterium]MBQ8266901.1 hypothetical protein [Clostridia bacterium]
MNNNFDKIDKKTLEAARRGDTDAVMSGLSTADRQKVNEVLADKDKLKQILSSDAAQQLMKILGGKQNG